MPSAPSSAEPMTTPSAEPDVELDVGLDVRLRLARRIDWRFLLDDPALGRVVVAGSPDPALVAALEAASTAVGVIGSDASPSPDIGTADTVVVAGAPDPSVLRAAVARLRPGGWLVAEPAGPLAAMVGGNRTGGPAEPIRTARRLSSAGFDPIRLHWTWPSHGRATAFAGLGDATAVRALVERRGLGRMRPITARVAGLLASTPLPALVVPAVTLIARRRDGTALDRAPAGGFVARRLVELAATETAAPGGDRRRSVLLLTPRYRASAHVVALAFDGPGRPPVLVAKIARLPDGGKGLAREAAALRALEPTLGGAGGCPVPVALDTAGWPILVETGVGGEPLDPAAVRADRAGAVRAIVDWLAGLPIDPAGMAGGAVVAGGLDAALAAAETLLAPTDASGDDTALLERTRRVFAPLRDATLPRVFEHGDLAHPNLLRRPDGRLTVVDWERADPAGLPLHDLVVALAYVAAAERGASSPADGAAAFADAVAGADPWAAAPLEAECRRLGVDPALRPALLVAPWVRTAAWLATGLGDGGAGETGDLADWLRVDRSMVLWRAMVRMAETA